MGRQFKELAFSHSRQGLTLWLAPCRVSLIGQAGLGPKKFWWPHGDSNPGHLAENQAS